MKQFITQNFKYVLFVLAGLFVMYWMIYLFTPKPQMSELDKYKIEQLNKNIESVMKKQEQLDKKITDFKSEITKIDSTIAQVRNQKTIIKEYYKELGDDIRTMTPSEVNRKFKERYKY